MKGLTRIQIIIFKSIEFFSSRSWSWSVHFLLFSHTMHFPFNEFNLFLFLKSLKFLNALLPFYSSNNYINFITKHTIDQIPANQLCSAFIFTRIRIAKHNKHCQIWGIRFKEAKFPIFAISLNQ